MSVPADNSSVVALLTAAHHLGDTGTAALVATMGDDEVRGALHWSISLLLQEFRLGCSDSGLDLDEYLMLMGLAAARTAT